MRHVIGKHKTIIFKEEQQRKRGLATLIFATLLLIAGLGTAYTEEAKAITTLIQNVKIFDDMSETLATGMSVLVEGNKIAKIGKALKAPKGAPTIGVFFMDTGGYLNMCGHGTIGSATAIVESGLVPVTEPYTEVVLKTPAGIIRTKVKVENSKAVHVTLTNVPSFLYLENQEIEIDGQNIVYDISFGGSFFALVDTTKIGIEVNAENIPKIGDIGMKLLNKINKTVKVQHPTLDITSVDFIEFYGPATDPEANLKNVVIFGDAMVDRSPCGTGTSAKLAAL